MKLRWAKAGFYTACLFWTIWLILKTYNTPCFSLFDNYGTIITTLSSMIVNDLNK